MVKQYPPTRTCPKRSYERVHTSELIPHMATNCFLTNKQANKQTKENTIDNANIGTLENDLSLCLLYLTMKVHFIIIIIIIIIIVIIDNNMNASLVSAKAQRRIKTKGLISNLKINIQY